MSGASWDDEDYEVTAPAKPVDDRWDGEDEDNIKDNWDDEEEEENKQQEAKVAPVKKKSLAVRIAEKQAEKEAALKAKREEIAKMTADMTPEEKLAEKQRLQKMQEESDLEFAVDMMGIKDADKEPEITSLKDADLSNEAGLQLLGTSLVKKIRETDRLEKKAYYVTFLDTLIKDLATNLETDEIKKLTQSLNALYNDKVKANKPTKGKKKGGSKAKLHAGKETDVVGDDRYIDDFYDFM